MDPVEIEKKHQRANILIVSTFFVSLIFIALIIYSAFDNSATQSEKKTEVGFTNIITPIPKISTYKLSDNPDFFEYSNQKAALTPTTTSMPLPTSVVNSCDRTNAQYLPDVLEITPAVYVTRTVQRDIMTDQIDTDYGPIKIKSETIITNDNYIYDSNGVPPTQDEIKTFKLWAASHGIALIPTYRSYDELMNGTFNLNADQIPLEQIGQVMNAYEALKLLPKGMIEKLRGTGVYMSNVDEKVSYALYSHESPEEIAKLYKTNPNVVRHGIFLIQPVSVRVTIHEIGHLIGSIGIKGLYGDEYSPYKHLRTEYNNIFKINGLDNAPCGYITEYSTTNESENFADHFSYYVTYGKEFRERAATDTLLQVKYDFLKEHIFEGKEY